MLEKSPIFKPYTKQVWTGVTIHIKFQVNLVLLSINPGKNVYNSQSYNQYKLQTLRITRHTALCLMCPRIN